MKIISVDIETSGLDPQRHSILSIGAETLDGETFYEEVAYEDVLVCPKAMEVNQLKLKQDGRTLRGALVNLSNWLADLEISPPLIALGMNVGSFDLLFLRVAWSQCKGVIGRSFPFHYRSIDLNSIIMFLNLDKKDTQNIIAADMKNKHWPYYQPHHAGWDAKFNVVMYHYLRGQLDVLHKS